MEVPAAEFNSTLKLLGGEGRMNTTYYTLSSSSSYAGLCAFCLPPSVIRCFLLQLSSYLLLSSPVPIVWQVST